MINNDWHRVGSFAAASSAFEIGAGSLLHSLRVPLRGHLLANLQGAVLSAYLDRRRARCRRVFWVSALSGALKSLSPAGSRLRPMLAIFMQGALFHGAVNLLGPGLAGVSVGHAMIGAWCGFQTFFFQYLLFGSDLLRGYESLFRWAASFVPLPSPGAALAGWVAASSLFSAALGTTFFLGFFRLENFRVPALELAPPRGGGWAQSARSAMGELRRPYFLGPLAFMVFFTILTGRGWERAAWISARALLFAFAAALLVRRIELARVAAWLSRKGFSGPATALEVALSGAAGAVHQRGPYVEKGDEHRRQYGPDEHAEKAEEGYAPQDRKQRDEGVHALASP